ncbi:MAG: hypothetical protein DRP56_03370 [Planctomycetota bacterium]|nr:MAG: hypothetical protein DRP56_03370 [Planctomycetota bacterium]
MNKLITILFIIVIVNFSFADSGVLTSEQEDQLATLSEILHFIYEDNPSAIPSDVNDIVALGESASSRDMLALALIQMMKDVYEGKTNPAVEQTVDASPTLESDTVDQQSVVSDEPISEIDFTLPPVKTVNYFEEQEKQKHLMNCPDGVALSDFPILDRSAVQAAQFSAKSDRSGLFLSSIETTGSGMMMSTESIIDITSDITANTVWDSNNIYHVLAPIDVNEVMLVIEPGTTVTFAAGTSAGIRALNGGAIIARGSAENPILFTSDASTPAYNDYHCPLYIEETASAATEITYSIVEYAHAGVMLFNRNLDNNIENNYFVNCMYGIVEYGPEHTDIINNLCFGSYYSGIQVFMASLSGAGDANSVIHIENNTSHYYQDRGITIRGTTDSNDTGYVFLGNNIVSDSYVVGLSIVDSGDEYVYASVINTGYYDNAANKHWAFDEYNPVIVTANPYEAGASGYAPICYLNQICDFIDAGGLFPEQTEFVGKTTSTTLIPDANVTDIGFHYPNWDYSNSGYGDYYAGDLDENLIIDFRDFSILAGGWLTAYDMNDLVEMSESWLITGGPAPNIIPSFDQDPNNLSGYVKATINITDSQIHRAWLIIDGKKYGEFCDSGESSTIDIKTERFSNGNHSVKVVYMYNDEVICSQATATSFDNEVSLLLGGDGFTPGENYHLFGIASGNHLVELVDIINETTIFSQIFTDGINAHIEPNAFTEEYGAYDLSIKEETMLMSATWQDVVNWVIGRKFNKKDFPPDVDIRMVVSVGDKSLEKEKEQCWKAALKTAVRKGIWPVFLNAEACTWDNLSHCLHLNRVKMWYHCSHGHHDLLGQPPRQCITTASGKVFSYLKKDYDPNNVPPTYEELSPWYENNHSIAELGFFGTDKMTWVQFNACYSAKTAEFPYVLGMPIEEPAFEQIFIGWKGKALVNDILGSYNQFEEDYWDTLRWGHSLQTAVEDSLPPVGGTSILENFMYYGVIDWQYAHFRYPNIN